MPTRELPARPNIEHLKNQARQLLRQALASDASASARLQAVGVTPGNAKLADALHTIAVEYGFESWPALKVHAGMTSENPAEALTAAVQSNRAALVREVIARHPSLKSHLDEPLSGYSFDTPPLIAAVQKGNREMVDALLEAGADINARTRWWAGGFGVLDCAGPALADYLISRGATIDIHAAARFGMIERVRELLAGNSALVHARGGDGQLPLHFAANIEIAGLLLDHGADIDARDIDHESTAAQYMAASRHYEQWQAAARHDVVRFLISRGAQTDILMASAVGDLALVERFLNDDPENVRTTVSERCFPKRNPNSGGSIYFYGFGMTRTPHMIAREFGHARVFELLMQRSSPSLRLSQAAEGGDDALFRELLERHPLAVSRLSAQAARRIVGAAVRNNTHAVELLLSSGWPSGATLDNNQTALHYAAWHGNLAMAQALLAHHAPVEVRETEHGGSPLSWALHGSLHSWERDKGDYPGVTRALLAAGAAIPKPDHPLQAAEEVLAIIEKHS